MIAVPYPGAMPLPKECPPYDQMPLLLGRTQMASHELDDTASC